MRELYQEMILDHHKHPRNFGRLAGANRHAEGFNPLCGDRITVYALVEGSAIRDLSFEGSGCAICMASASVMTDELAGKSIDDADALYVRFHDLVTGESAKNPDLDALGKLAGKVFRIGHLGDLNELMLLGALGGAEMAMRDVGIDIEAGSGVAAAQEYWRRTDPIPKKRVSRQEVIYASHSSGSLEGH
jgi:SUF system NifU family Fe-S assembly protein